MEPFGGFSAITFISEEARHVKQTHDDALVVTMKVANHNVDSES